MLLLLFNIGKDRFGLEVNHIIEILPLVEFKIAPHTPEYVAGLFNYRGTIVPVIDLSMLISGTPSRPLLSTRIILVDYIRSDYNHHVLGLMAEYVTETIPCREEDFKPSTIVSKTAQYIGDIIIHEDEMIQRIKIENILPKPVQELLFLHK